MNKVVRYGHSSRLLVVIVLVLACNSILAQHSQEYLFNIKGDNIGFFDSGASYVDSTIYFDQSISYGIDDLVNNLGLSSSNPFNWTADLDIIDLSPVTECCDLGTIGWDFDMDFTLGASMWMQHQVDGGAFSINYPMRLNLTIPEFNRGDEIQISLDSSYTSTPTLGITNPTLTKDLKTGLTFQAGSDLDMYLGPFGSHNMEFFDVNDGYESTLLHVGSDGFSGDLGLVVDSYNCSGSEYTYTLDSDNDAYDGDYQANICSGLAPCLDGVDILSEWTNHCKLRVPFTPNFITDMLGGSVNGVTLSDEPWSTTAPQLELDWPFGLGLTLDYPDDDVTENLPNWATGALTAQTTDAVPYFHLTHNYLDMLEDILKYSVPDYPSAGESGNAANPYAYAALFAIDNRKSADNAFLESKGALDGERVSVWTYLDNQLGSINLPWGDYSLEDVTLFDFWIEYNVLDLESNFTVTNSFGVEYAPEVRVKLHFSDSILYKTDATATEWTAGDIVDMPIEGDFQLKTTCDQYDLEVEPVPYLVTTASDMTNTGTDNYATYLDIDALNFNVGIDGAPIIPSFEVDFLCVDSPSSFWNSVTSCARHALHWVEGAWCCFKNWITFWDWEFSCSNCWKDNPNECELCSYGFPGLSTQDYNMAADVCPSSEAYQENGMCGYFWRLPFSSTDDTYATSEWFVDDVDFIDPGTGVAFDGEELLAESIPFELYSITPTGLAMDYGVRNAAIDVSRTGGVKPMTIHARQIGQPTGEVFNNPDILTTANGESSFVFTNVDPLRNVSFVVSEGDRFIAKPSILERYTLQDANGCFADFVKNNVTFQSFGADLTDLSDEMLGVGIPYQLPNDAFCGDSDNDGCNDCSSGVYNPSDDGSDYDQDGICNFGDLDDDNDGVVDSKDSDPLNEFVCSDLDSDGCDDCASGTFDPANDGVDSNADGICDTGDPDIDGDGALNENDTDDSNAFVCSDNDNDGCDDCSSGSYDTYSDGDDFDGDGICDSGDNDIDGDSVVNSSDPDDYDTSICGDSDGDGCDDCNSGTFDTANDGTDTDEDGICDSLDDDIDGDGALNDVDSNDYNAFICSDSDGDSCDDCSSGQFNPYADGSDFDGDGLCDSGDDDIDGDGIANDLDNYDYNASRCSDDDGDGCDDCSSGSYDLVNDGSDLDGDGLCNFGDSDMDGDGVEDEVFNWAGSQSYEDWNNADDDDNNDVNTSDYYIILDPDSLDSSICGDLDNDGCDDCSQLDTLIIDTVQFVFTMYSHITGETLVDSVEVVINDGTDTDGDGFCDDYDAFASDATEYLDGDSDGIGFYSDCNDGDNAVGQATIYYEDSDGDGYGITTGLTAYFCEAPCDTCGSWSINALDCNDSNALIYTGADELCDGLDNDCDNQIDEDPVDGTTWYLDADGDGLGDPNSSVDACSAPVGYVSNNSDTDDTTP